MLMFKKKALPIVYKNYDALLFLPSAIVNIDKKTRIIEKNGVHVAIMYSETSGISVLLDLPVDFLKLYYKMTTQVNQGNPSDRIVYFAIVHISPQAYARKRVKVLKMNANTKRKFFVFPRWIWLNLERNNDVTNYFLINKFEDDNPANYSKEFDTFGAVGITFNNYFIFASVARKEYIASINKQISLGLGLGL
ncbi:hypothetical protein CF87_gp30 [Sulfolobus monocaudavirus SMV1]|uniref:hypothetical protein n=1 Tax=Sulfolobus monocaudavirus SMV1 TaxID=1351702 RepID=UPI0003D8D2E9|nr:hypothetical protein CF87_gp30 [Sulfolobus monocaudavirus SMV1]CDF81357.1 hypothetical protein [Sulfolobus monocaudavirus SMV1]